LKAITDLAQGTVGQMLLLFYILNTEKTTNVHRAKTAKRTLLKTE